MLIDTNSMVSITEANQNFSKVTKIVDEKGTAVILKNNSPKYVVLQFNELEENEYASLEEVKELSSKIINKNIEAFKELAKWKF